MSSGQGQGHTFVVVTLFVALNPHQLLSLKLKRPSSVYNIYQIKKIDPTHNIKLLSFRIVSKPKVTQSHSNLSFDLKLHFLNQQTAQTSVLNKNRFLFQSTRKLGHVGEVSLTPFGAKCTNNATLKAWKQQYKNAN